MPREIITLQAGQCGNQSESLSSASVLEIRSKSRLDLLVT